VRVWDLRQPTAPPRVLVGHNNLVTSVAYSPTGNCLASASADRTVAVWDLRTPEAPPAIFTGHQGAVSSVAFAPDGNRLASAGLEDKTVRVWDLRQPKAPALILVGHQAEVQSVAFAPDGNHLASAGRDGTVRVWPLWSGAADYLCTIVWRNLSIDEWRFYMGTDIPYEPTCPSLPPGKGAPAPKP
jgi:WD40 repeat protein